MSTTDHGSTTRTAIEYLEAPRLIDLLPLYERYLIGEQRRPQGVGRYLFAMRRVIAFLGPDATIADLDRRAVQRYKEELGARCASATVGNMLCTVRDFCLWAINAGLRTDDPTAGVKRPPKRRPNPNPLYGDEVATLLRAIADAPPAGSQAFWYWRRNRLAVYVFLYTGLRLAEVAQLTWSHINLHAGVLKVFDGKGGKDRVIPIHHRLAVELAAVPGRQRLPGMPVIAQPSGKPLTRSGVEKIFRYWLSNRLAGMGLHLYAHRLRHTFASHLVWHDVDLATVADLLGHADISTTAHYVKIDDRRKRAGVDRLPDFGDPTPDKER